MFLRACSTTIFEIREVVTAIGRKHLRCHSVHTKVWRLRPSSLLIHSSHGFVLGSLRPLSLRPSLCCVFKVKVIHLLSHLGFQNASRLLVHSLFWHLLRWHFLLLFNSSIVSSWIGSKVVVSWELLNGVVIILYVYDWLDNLLLRRVHRRQHFKLFFFLVCSTLVFDYFLESCNLLLELLHPLLLVHTDTRRVWIATAIFLMVNLFFESLFKFFVGF